MVGSYLKVPKNWIRFIFLDRLCFMVSCTITSRNFLPNHEDLFILCQMDTFVWFYGISNIVDYLMPNPIYINISSSPCDANSTDIPDTLSPPLPIVHGVRQVFGATSRIYTELLYVGSSWSLCLCLSMWRGSQECITYELVPTSPVVSRMCGSSDFDSFRDGL